MKPCNLQDPSQQGQHISTSSMLATDELPALLAPPAPPPPLLLAGLCGRQSTAVMQPGHERVVRKEVPCSSAAMLARWAEVLQCASAEPCDCLPAARWTWCSFHQPVGACQNRAAAQECEKSCRRQRGASCRSKHLQVALSSRRSLACRCKITPRHYLILPAWRASHCALARRALARPRPGKPPRRAP